MEKKKILVIEDDEDTVDYITILFQDHGFSTLQARNGEEGLATARREIPDLITLDISMPEKSGVKTLHELQTDPATANIPVIVVTGVSPELETFIKHRKKIKPPAGYVFKPIEQEELLEMVNRFLT